MLCFAHYDNFSKWYIAILQDKSNFFVLHVKKCFSGTTVNPIVHVSKVNCLVFSICYFGSVKNVYKTWQGNGRWWNVDKNVFKSCQCRIIWYLLPGFKTINVCSVHSIRFVKYVSFARYVSRKLELESWNANHESLNRTLWLFCGALVNS